MATKRATKEEDSTGEKSTTGDETETKVKGEPCSYFGIVLLFLIHLSYTYLIDTATPKPIPNSSFIYVPHRYSNPKTERMELECYFYYGHDGTTGHHYIEYHSMGLLLPERSRITGIDPLHTHPYSPHFCWMIRGGCLLATLILSQPNPNINFNHRQ